MITHLSCIMDGNRRWAQQRGQLPWNGHRAGAKTIEMVISFCLENKIPHLSLYTFSLENFNRSDQERSYLFDLIMLQTERYLPQFIAQGIAIKFVGQLSLFPKALQEICYQVQDKTAHGKQLQVYFLFGYGSRQEIFQAAQLFAERIRLGQDNTQEQFESCLWTAGVPDPDLMIRTGGMLRLSNFLLYQAAYTEIRFLDTLWPDLTQAEVHAAVMSAIQAQKNGGK